MKHFRLLFLLLCIPALTQADEFDSNSCLSNDLPAELESLGQAPETSERNCGLNSIAQITTSQLPFTITQPGFYCVNEDLSPPVNLNSQPIITIASSNVILNLNYKRLIGSASTTTGILVNNQNNVT